MTPEIITAAADHLAAVYWASGEDPRALEPYRRGLIAGLALVLEIAPQTVAEMLEREV